jgi:hypothetical protein
MAGALQYSLAVEFNMGRMCGAAKLGRGGRQKTHQDSRKLLSISLSLSLERVANKVAV